VRLSGVDPSIIRELSGIYKPFVKAFKELISNAYDADATTITVSVARNFSTIEVHDNGTGLTAIEFHRDFARLGGSTAWQNQGRSPGGRPRIGYKGIGFLAVARYCSRMEVESRTLRRHEGSLVLPPGRRKSVNVIEALGSVVPARLLRPRLKITRVALLGPRRRVLKARGDFAVHDGVVEFRSKRVLASGREREISYSVDFSDLVLKASLDFDYLLGLERKADLQKLENFCDVVVAPTSPNKTPGTRIRLLGLKDFVMRDLAAPRHRGKGWNIGAQSGKEQFLWRLARTSPIEDAFPAGELPPPLTRVSAIQKRAKLPQLFIRWRDEAAVEVTRATCLGTSVTDFADSVVPIDLNESGLRAVGYLIAKSEVVYPAELRGISVRVRNVAIGDPSFFGLERTLAGARKAALSQISGEIMVLDGLDASDAINPGRESFYEENPHYRILKRILIGSEEALGGMVGQAIRLITDRRTVRSQVTEKLGAAKLRRKVLTDISSAVNTSSHIDAALGERLVRFFETPLVANGLGDAKDVPIRPAARLGAFELHDTKGLGEEFTIDFAKKSVAIDFSRDIWSQSVYLAGKYYEVCFKQGSPTDPMCEFDNVAERIYVNWGHPVKFYMDETGYLRSAIIWRLAYHAAGESADAMINLALTLLAHRAE